MANYRQSSDFATKSEASNVLYGYYIRKPILSRMMRTAFLGTTNASSSQINVFIDLNDIAVSVMKTNAGIDPNYGITCALINMIAHYKSFLTSYNVDVEFYLVYSGDNYGGIIARNRYPEYCNDLRISLFNPNQQGKYNWMKSNFKLASVILQYIPHCHFIQSSEDSALTIYNQILRTLVPTNPVPNIVITKDPICNQLCLITNTVIFRPKKSMPKAQGEMVADTSYVINGKTAIENTLQNTQIATSTLCRLESLLPTQWSLFFSLYGIKSRGIVNLYDLRRAIAITQEHPEPIVNIESVIPENDPEYQYKQRYILNNYYSIDLPYKHKVYMQIPESQLTLPPTLFDNNGLKQLNDQYFNSKGLFIDLMTLLK